MGWVDACWRQRDELCRLDVGELCCDAREREMWEMWERTGSALYERDGMWSDLTLWPVCV